VIESPFATVRLRQRVTKGAGSRTKGLLMAYKLLDMAQARCDASMAHTYCRSSEPASPSWTACSTRGRATGRERREYGRTVCRTSPFRFCGDVRIRVSRTNR